MTIPASAIASVLPGVISAGGQGLVLNGVALTANTRVPVGQAVAFSSLGAVQSFFGANSVEASLAANYFGGFTNCTQLPGMLYFWQYCWQTPVSAYLRGTSVAALTLSALQAITGSLSLTIDGSARTWSSVNLSGATSFSQAATQIASGLGLTGGQSCTFDSVAQAFVITSGTTGTSSTITLASGTAAAALGLSTGATLSQGAPVSTPAAAMNAICVATQNWACFATVFEPVLADKLAFANWTASQNNRFAYISWDTDPNASVANNQTCFGYQIEQLGVSGVYAISGDPAYATSQGTTLAALLAPVAFFNMGIAASINFSQKNGRTTFAFCNQAGLAYSVANQQIGANLIANGYNFYGAYATANQGFVFNYPGQVSGEFDFMDEYINQIWLNSNFQLAMMELYQNTLSIPYNNAGYSLIRQGLTPAIVAAANFGAFVAGVELSAAQISEVNGQAGLDISTALYNSGYYLQILDPGAQARQARKSPIMNFWYTDGGSVQSMSLASIDVQ
jgi:hypothetical protein